VSAWTLIARFLARPAVADYLIRRAQRTPYSPIVKDGDLYMERFWLFNPYPDSGQSGADRKPWRFPLSIRIHHIWLPDQDRDLHDHPWNARTIILRGWYIEERTERPFRSVWEFAKQQVMRCNVSGDTATLKYGEFHRITEVSDGGVWTLFITGKYRGTWGFSVDGIKVQWRKYLGLEPKP
jgi:hypothetical protein